MKREFWKNALIGGFVLFIAFMTGCQTPGPTLTEAVTATHFRMLNRAETQQAYFQRHIRAGMSKDEVVQLAINTSRSVSDGWYKDGQPENTSFEVAGDTTYETWEYSYYSKVFVLVFENDHLIRFSDKPGVTAMDNM